MFNKKYTKLVAAMGVTLFAGAAQAAIVELAPNGNLETGDFSGGNWVLFPNGGTIDIVSPGSASTYGAQLSAIGQPIGVTLKMANVGAGQLVPGQAFTVNFDWKGNNAVGGVLDIRVFSELSGGGVSKTDILAGGPIIPSDWTSFGVGGNGVDLIAGPDVSGGVTLEMTAICGADAGCFSNVFIDNVSITADVSAVPVPAAVWLFGSGLLGLVGVARRKRNS
jgi:hypothetical protein